MTSSFYSPEAGTGRNSRAAESPLTDPVTFS